MLRNLLILITVTIAAAGLIWLATGEAPERSMTCEGGTLGKSCEMTQGEYLGFKIGMSKTEAMESACNGEAKKYVVDPWFRVSDTDLRFNRVYHGEVKCEYLEDALKADRWIFHKKRDLMEGNVSLYFSEDRIVRMTYNYSALII